MQKLDERVFNPNDVDLDQMYQVFYDQYMKSTGKAWSRDKFMDRVKNWTFVGEPTSFIALRKQKSGNYKLVSVAGDMKGKLKAFNELTLSHFPIWGVVTEDIKNLLVKKGFISPPTWLLKLMVPLVTNQYGDIQINSDGSVDITDSETGTFKKFFICNKEFFKNSMSIPQMKIPAIAKGFIKKMISEDFEIDEARKNPESNPRITNLQWLEKYKDDPSIYISFTEREDLKFNYYTRYDTPMGIYCYPLVETWGHVEKNSFPFAANKQFIQLIRNKSNNFLNDISKLNGSDYVRLVNNCVDLLLEECTDVQKEYLIEHYIGEENKFDSHDIKRFVISKWEQDAKFRDYGTKIWNITRMMALVLIKGRGASNDGFNKKITSNGAKKWRDVLVKVGIDGAADKSGLGIIHSNEPIQAVFLSPKSFDWIGSHNNSFINQKTLERKTDQIYPIFSKLIVKSNYDKITSPMVSILEKADPTTLVRIYENLIPNNLYKKIPRSINEKLLNYIINDPNDVAIIYVINILFNFATNTDGYEDYVKKFVTNHIDEKNIIMALINKYVYHGKRFGDGIPQYIVSASEPSESDDYSGEYYNVSINYINRGGKIADIPKSYLEYIQSKTPDNYIFILKQAGVSINSQILEQIGQIGLLTIVDLLNDGTFTPSDITDTISSKIINRSSVGYGDYMTLIRKSQKNKWVFPKILQEVIESDESSYSRYSALSYLAEEYTSDIDFTKINKMFFSNLEKENYSNLCAKIVTNKKLDLVQLPYKQMLSSIAKNKTNYLFYRSMGGKIDETKLFPSELKLIGSISDNDLEFSNEQEEYNYFIGHILANAHYGINLPSVIWSSPMKAYLYIRAKLARRYYFKDFRIEKSAGMMVTNLNDLDRLRYLYNKFRSETIGTVPELFQEYPFLSIIYKKINGSDYAGINEIFKIKLKDLISY